jgi:glycosyltransferase involved in cell wall biosynthesis/SAM-dependent methyltransferase
MNKTYYDNPALWTKAPEPYMVQMQQDLLDLLPPGIASLLDVGCGNGFIINALPAHLRVLGLDMSREALRHVTPGACRGDIFHLPCGDAAFDLVMANDVLEHLQSEGYGTALAELFRAARNFVIITVPFLEDLTAGHVLCHNCGRLFHKNQHQRSFGLDELQHMAPEGWCLAQVVFSGVEWDNEPLEMARLRQGLGIYASAEHACCPACGWGATPHDGSQVDEAFLAISTSLAANRLRQHDYASCRTEAICCFHRTTRPNPWASVIRGAAQTTPACAGQRLEIDPLEIDFRARADWHRKGFLPTWGAQAYFYADKHICTDTDGLHLEAGQEVKLGFFVHAEAPLMLEGTAVPEATIEVRSYGLLGYQLLHSLHVQAHFAEHVTPLEPSFSLHPYGTLLSLRCIQGTMSLHRCRYAAHLPRQQWLHRQAAQQPRYIALPIPLALSAHYYGSLLPPGEAALASIQARTQALQALPTQPVTWPVVSWLIQRVAEWQRAGIARLEPLTGAQSLLQTQLAALNSRHGTLQEAYEALQRQHESLQSQYNTIQQQYATLERLHSDLQTHLVAQAARLDSFAEQLYTLRIVIATCARLRRLWHRLKSTLRQVTAPLQSTGGGQAPSAPAPGADTAPVSVPTWESRTAVMLVPDDRIDRRVLLEARSLIRHGWQVTVVAAPPPTPDYRLDEELFPEVHIVRVDASQAVHIPAALQSPFVPPGEDNWQDFYWLTNHYYLAAAQAPAQVVVAHDLPVLPAAIMAAAFHQAFLIYDAHELYPEQHHFGPEHSARCRRVESALAPFPQHVITVNTSIAQEMVQRYHIAAPTIILNCPAYDSPHTAQGECKDLRSALGIAAEKKVLLFQGSLSLNRNLEPLVHAMALLTRQDVALVLMGPGEAKRQELEDIAMHEHILGSVVYFHPAVPQCDVIPYTRSADAGIIPYPHIDLNSYYCTPNKLFDFLVAGIPILANNSPELKRYVADLGVGMVHNMSDAAEIALAIDEFFAQDHAAYKSRLHEIGQEYVWEREGQKLVAVYDELVSANHCLHWPVKD